MAGGGYTASEHAVRCCELPRELLKEHQFRGTLDWVSDGVEAIDYLCRRGSFVAAPRPDVVILDLNLPRLDGREFLQELRRHPDLRELPVIVWTTSSRPLDAHESWALGARTFYTKPADLVGFESLVRRLATLDFPNVQAPRP